MSSPQKKPSPGGLLPRVITAVVAVPILLWVILVGAPWTWLVVVTIGTVIGLVEITGMTIGQRDAPTVAMSVGLGTLLVPTIYYAPNGYLALGALVVIALALMLTTLATFSATERAAPVLTASLAGIIYVSVFLALIALLRRDPGELGRYWILMLLAVTWGGDTGAYFVGRALGRHKLAPRVSPKKTWEGAAGGALVSVGAAFIVLAVTPLELSAHFVVLLALPAAILGQLGDLVESLIKRSCGVKDSGRIIYGHGGILDRIDGLLFSGPYFYLFYRFTFGSAAIG